MKDGISDHSAITCLLDLKRPPVPTETIVTRRLNAIDIDAFCEDISRSDLNSSHAFSDFDLTTQVNIYSDTLTSLLDQHAPAKTRKVKIRHNKSWYNDAIREEKQNRRHLEHAWRKSRLEVDRQLYRQQKQKVVFMIRKAKYNHFNQLFLENTKDQKRLFQIADKLLHRKHTSPLPQSQSDEKLANEFSIFFTDKIKKNT